MLPCTASIDTFALRAPFAVHRHADAEAQHQDDQEEDEEEGEPVGHEPGVVGDRLDPDLANEVGVGRDAAHGHQVGVVAVHAKNQTLVVSGGAVVVHRVGQQLGVDGRV